MKQPGRVTISLDEEAAELFKKVRTELKVSQSELMREALKFYDRYRVLYESLNADKVQTYIEMLAHGEHVIMDIDHWLLFLKFIESHPEKEQFWELNKAICEAHAEQFKHQYHRVEPVLRRLEACNFFKLSEDATNAFTLILGSDITRRFIKSELEDIFERMGFEVGIKEDLTKLRVSVLHDVQE